MKHSAIGQSLYHWMMTVFTLLVSLCLFPGESSAMSGHLPHFFLFLAHYFRDTYDRNMAQLPTIMSGV